MGSLKCTYFQGSKIKLLITIYILEEHNKLYQKNIKRIHCNVFKEYFRPNIKNFGHYCLKMFEDLKNVGISKKLSFYFELLKVLGLFLNRYQSLYHSGKSNIHVFKALVLYLKISSQTRVKKPFVTFFPANPIS